MEYENPILITLNNTLHIKADNLEAVEVDSSCADELSDLVFKGTKWFIKGKTNDKYYLQKGVDISELSDRIEVRDISIAGFSPTSAMIIKRAFLLYEKEDKLIVGEDMICPITKKHCDDECCPVGAECNAQNNDIVDYQKSYTIEEIERAIDKLPFSQVLRNTIKVDVKNNLKK